MLIIWLIGLSGSGKTTIGQRLFQLLKQKGRPIVFVDGDLIRDLFDDVPDYSREGRYRNAKRICQLCRYLDNNQIDVVAAVLSIFPEWQEWNRRQYTEYFEIFLDVTRNTLVKRDPKGFYAKALSGDLKNFVGVDIEFPRPENPNFTIDESIMNRGIDYTITRILEELKL